MGILKTRSTPGVRALAAKIFLFQKGTLFFNVRPHGHRAICLERGN
jgi:hypothetical protein